MGTKTVVRPAGHREVVKGCYGCRVSTLPTRTLHRDQAEHEDVHWHLPSPGLGWRDECWSQLCPRGADSLVGLLHVLWIHTLQRDIHEATALPKALRTTSLHPRKGVLSVQMVYGTSTVCRARHRALAPH